MANSERLSGYELSRRWFDFAFDTKDCKVHHTALYMWIIELNNRLGWKSEFGLPTQDTMEGLSIGNKKTYLTTLRSLNDWGFVEIIKESKNQYQACIIKLCHSKSATARGTALDTALIQHSNGIGNGTSVGTSVGNDNSIGSSIAPIDKPLTNQPLNQKPERGKPSELLIYNFLKENTVQQGWTDNYCKKKATIFEKWFDNNWSVPKNRDWQKRLSEFILSEKDPEIDLPNKVSDGRDIPNEADNIFYSSLQKIEDKQKVSKKWIGAGYYHVNSGKKSEMGWFKTIPKIPESIYPDAKIPSGLNWNSIGKEQKHI